MRIRESGLLSLLVATVAISFAAVFFRKAEPTHPLISAGFRLGFAAIVMLPFSLRHFKGVGRKEIGFACLGGLFYAVHFGAWVWSLSLTSVAASTTLVTATPLVLAIIGWRTGKDRPSRSLWVALLFTSLGVCLIAAHDLGSHGSQLLGDALAFLGALGMVGYLLIARKLNHHSPWLILNISAAVGGVILLLLAICLNIPLEAASPTALFWIGMATLVPQLIGHTALTFSLRFAAPTTVAMTTVAEPAAAAFLAWLILGDTAPGIVIIGCSITLFGVATAALDQARVTKDNTHLRTEG
jgi:drug/metabolite transporter (DMT)-like permease